VPDRDGQVVLVTGAASGIGRATVARLAASGAAVALVDRDAERIASAVPAGARAITIVADVADETDVRDAVARSVEELGGLGGLVTAAGIFDPAERRPVAEVELGTFVRTLAVNLTGTFLAVKYALPHLAASGGSIVTIASTAALRAHGFGAGYTASKGGVDALTRLLAVQYGPQGVRANCVCPGGVDTPMTAGVFSGPDAAERARRGIPLGRYAQADDLADVVAFLLSDDARYLTGQTIPVEGGATIA
jgi:NAD(P)-dependent dehydrogenase (short-subunit alcohol dehydrogenase family)